MEGLNEMGLIDGTQVAIKRLTSGGQQGGKEFLVEVEMLSRLHHCNLIKIVGYYSSRDSSQNLLCYELVPNGCLEQWLHGPLGLNCPLDWDTRMKIALDAARGLADFGLAKQAPEGRVNYLSTRVMGTFGILSLRYDFQTTAMADPDFPMSFDRLELSVRGLSSSLRLDLHLVPPSVLMALPSVMSVAPLQAILRYSTTF
ncbi:hypothetical protein AgCh_005418 [Apium graveolens]